MASSSKPRSQGGGRKANSEPRQQVFRDFAGCNFGLSPRDFTLGKEVDQEQSDLQMNYVVIQNNVSVAMNKTLETRNNLVKIVDAPTNRVFTGPCAINDNLIVLAADGGKAYVMSLYSGDDHQLHPITVTDHSGDTPARVPTWKAFCFYPEGLIGTSQYGLWTGSVNSAGGTLDSATPIVNPATLTITNLSAQGNLEISGYPTSTCVFRVSVAFSYVSKFGPTAASTPYTFYANYPVNEWDNSKFLKINGGYPPSNEVKAVEIYYSTGNSSSLIFAGRKDIPNNSSPWTFDWIGYIDSTSMWAVSNLIAPTENYTEGVGAEHVAWIDGRLYFWYVLTIGKPGRLYIGGNAGNLLSVSPGTGGGYVDTFDEIKYVAKYKTQSGASIITMLCSKSNSSQDKRYNLVENTVSLSNEQTMKSWQAEEVAGAVGCSSFNGALVCEDGLYSITNYGLALTTMTMEYNSQIRTNYVSDAIKPVFTNRLGNEFYKSFIIERDGIIYLALGKARTQIAASAADETLEEQSSDLSIFDNILFCYDIDQKAWWTITLDVDEPILSMFHLDWKGTQEGIGIVTPNHVYMLPLTQDDSPETAATFPVVIQTGELSTTQPQQNWCYLAQMEFNFDYFLGSVVVELTGIDQFGRKVTTKKTITHETAAYNLTEFMRVDQRLRSYQIRITGQARFRLTHFVSKVYTMSAKQGLVWGFDDSQSYRSDGDIHPTFLDYNDVRQAIIP